MAPVLLRPQGVAAVATAGRLVKPGRRLREAMEVTASVARAAVLEVRRLARVMRERRGLVLVAGVVLLLPIQTDAQERVILCSTRPMALVADLAVHQAVALPRLARSMAVRGEMLLAALILRDVPG